MAELKGSKTEQNLHAAFAGESQARNKYTYFASVAKKEGYEQIAAIFLETADNEKEHAKLHFQALSGLGDTRANLKAAAAGEGYEWTEMYPTMAREARAEGFDEIARIFDQLAKIEKTHQERYRKLLQNVETGKVFRKDQKVVSGHPKPASDGHLKTSHLDEVVHRAGYLPKGGLSHNGEPDQDGNKCFNHRALRTRLVPAANCA